MANILTAYAASSPLTISLGGLATSSTFVAGRQSTAVDNTSNLYLDYMLGGKIKVGTTPNANSQIYVYVAGMADDGTWPDAMGAVDAAWASASVGVAASYLKQALNIWVDTTTTGRVYYFSGISVASLFGGVLPKKWAAIVSHNNGVALDATNGNHVLSITPSYLTAA